MITCVSVFLPRFLSLCLCFFGLSAGFQLIAEPLKDESIVTAQSSFGSAGPVSPTVPGDTTKQWFYSFCLPSGDSLNQTFPMELQLDNSNANPGESSSVSFGAVSSLAGVTGVPGTFTILNKGIAQTQNVTLITGSLADGTHIENVRISTDPSSKVALSRNTIHAYVSGSSARQFYYNMIWTNQGATQPITIDLPASSLNSQGTNAVHALVFDSTGHATDSSNFDVVNQDGTRCGPNTRPCTINVPAGKTLWVTWHLQPAGIGGSSRDMSDICPGNVTISATGKLKDSTGTVIGTCYSHSNWISEEVSSSNSISQR